LKHHIEGTSTCDNDTHSTTVSHYNYRFFHNEHLYMFYLKMITMNNEKNRRDIHICEA